MKVHFYLDRRKGKAERLPIFMHFWYKGKLLRVFTGEHCDPEEWDRTAERIKPGKDGVAEINKLLQSMGEEVLMIVRNARTGRRSVDIDFIRANLTFIKGTGRDFFSVWDEFINKQSVAKEWSTGMVRRFDILRMHLKIMDKQRRISFYDIDDHFYDRFIEYHHQQGFRKSYAARNLELFRWFMNWVTFNGYNLNMAYKNFKPPKSEPESDEGKYLTADELMKLVKLNTNNPVLETVKDIFCFGCLTGLRYADLIRLGEEHVIDGKLMYIRAKPIINLEIPLVDIAIKILNKYRHGTNGQIFPVLSIQDFNRHLKLLGRIAGLNAPVPLKDNHGTRSGGQTCRKWELLSSKYTRRTFVKLGVERGIGLEVMCELTGNLPGTIKNYYHIRSDHKKAEMQKLNML